MTNTPAYYSAELVKVVKSFTRQASSGNLIKILGTKLTYSIFGKLGCFIIENTFSSTIIRSSLQKE
jgi:hypothetical protein